MTYIDIGGLITMGRVDGKVAFITGVARGMGRSHAIRLAGEGADIIGLDLVEQVDSVRYPLATAGDLAETVKLVEAAGGRIVVSKGDVRTPDDVEAALASGLEAFGHVDIVIANAGIASFAPSWQMSEATWQDMIDINLTGVFHTVRAAIPSMIEAGNGGSIVLISSVAGIKGIRNLIHYSSAKHGLVGMMQGLANELAEYNIRVNTIHPTSVSTPMVINDVTFRAFRPDLVDPSESDIREAMLGQNALPIPYVEAIDVSNAILFLASDEARYITGVSLPIDGGALVK